LYQFKLDFSEFKILIIITRVTGKKIIKTSRKEIGGLRMVVYHCGKKKKIKHNRQGWKEFRNRKL